MPVAWKGWAYALHLRSEVRGERGKKPKHQSCEHQEAKRREPSLPDRPLEPVLLDFVSPLADSRLSLFVSFSAMGDEPADAV